MVVILYCPTVVYLGPEEFFSVYSCCLRFPFYFRLLWGFGGFGGVGLWGERVSSLLGASVSFRGGWGVLGMWLGIGRYFPCMSALFCLSFLAFL